MIAVVTDSNAQLPSSLVRTYGIRVVPITVVLDGHEYHEGVDLDTRVFYDRLAEGATVSTAAPSPAQILEIYADAARGGATSILSIHVGSNVSGTVNAVRLAASDAPVPVEIVDTGTASFAVGCCAWEAAELLRRGCGPEEAAAAARAVAAEIGNVFIVGALDLARAGGRLASDVSDGEGLPVLALDGDQMRTLGHARSVDESVNAMVDHVQRWAGGRPIGVGVGDALAPEPADALARALEALPEVWGLVRYEVGPSVGAHTGPGTVGAVFYPVRDPSCRGTKKG